MLFSLSFFRMSNLKKFALFGMLFMSSILLANGMYSNQVFAQVNEAEINVDIEQENKCKKDTECENENEINNSLNIVNITNDTQSQQQPVPSPCEDCFTSNLDQTEIDAFLVEFSNFVQQEITTLEQLCEYIDANQGTEALDIALGNASGESGLTFEQYEALIQCLQDSGINVHIPPI